MISTTRERGGRGDIYIYPTELNKNKIKTCELLHSTRSNETITKYRRQQGMDGWMGGGGEGAGLQLGYEALGVSACVTICTSATLETDTSVCSFWGPTLCVCVRACV